MDNEDIKEVRWVLRKHEDIIQANNALMIISSKIIELEH
jgi:hypothetical protein